MREGSTRDEWQTSNVNTNENESDLLTKLLPDGEKRKCFVKRLLQHIYNRGEVNAEMSMAVD